MSSLSTLEKNALVSGNYHLIEEDKVVELYEAAGFNLDDESAEFPDVLTIEGKECYFSGDAIMRGGKYYEIVIILNGFTWEELDFVRQEDDI